VKSHLLITVAALIFAGCATTKPRKSEHVPTPDVAIVQMPIDRAKAASTKATEKVGTARAAVQATSAKVRQLEQSTAVQEIQRDLDSVESELSEAQEQLGQTAAALVEATKRTGELQTSVDLLGKKYAESQDNLTTAEAKLATEINAHKATSFAYHRLKFFVALVLAIIAGLIATRFVPPGNLWWQIGAPIAVGAIVFLAAWKFL